MRRILLVAMALPCLLISGCLVDDSEDSACIQEGEAKVPILVSVGCGSPRTQPIYLWDDEGVSVIEVKRTLDGEAVWRLISVPLDDNNIQSPATHGIIQLGTIQEVSVEIELEVNAEYLVGVRRIAGGSGTRKFTILPLE